MTFVTLKYFVLLIFLFILSTFCVKAQVVEQQYYPTHETISLAEGIEIPSIDRGYTVWLPEGRQPKGLIVFFHSRPDTSESDTFIRYATENGLAVLYATTANRLDFFL